jgi:hypothetical protein
VRRHAARFQAKRLSKPLLCMPCPRPCPLPLVPPFQNDIGSGLPELQVMALSFLPHLPPQLLVELLEKGEHALSTAANSHAQSPLFIWHTSCTPGNEADWVPPTLLCR